MTNITRRQLLAAEKIAAKKKKNQRLAAGALGAGVVLSATFASAGAATAAPVSIQSMPVNVPATPSASAATTTYLNMRSGPGMSNSVIRVLPRHAQVQLRGQSSGGWVAVSYNGTSGWVSKAYLRNPSTASTTMTSSSPSSSSSSSSSTGTMSTTSALNMRTAAGVRNSVIQVLPRNAQVQLRGQSNGGWVAVSYNGTSGWVSKAYLRSTTATAASTSTSSTTKVVRTSSTSTASSVTGSWSTAVNFALGKVGDSRVGYVYGGNGPYGYDCSGFTKAIYAAAGKSLDRSSKLQYINAPTKVSMSNIQVGDLVFWSNNGSGSGVYHVAMYIGNGQIAHARNPSAGVSVTSLHYSPNNMLGTVGRY